MDPKRIIRSLEHIRKVYSKLLEPQSKSVVLPQAVASVEESREYYEYRKQNQPRGFVPEPWGYTINHDMPLRFTRSMVDGVELQVDVYCDVRWAEADVPVKQDIKVRVWSEHDPIIFDPARDSSEIQDELTAPYRDPPGRVVQRFHFDRANQNQPGPMYHFQVGGRPESYELCWHPESVKVPRLSFQPLELFLTCQIVAANFFWDDYIEIRNRSEWRAEVLQYQDLLLVDHFQECLDAIQSHKSLLDTLWMI